MIVDETNVGDHARTLSLPVNVRMIPIRDINPSLRTPVMTFLLLAASVAVFFFVQPDDPADEADFLYRQAAIACELTTGEPLAADEIGGRRCTDGGATPVHTDKYLSLSVIVSMFLHGGLAHLLANMWSLYLFGNNVEDAYGRIGYLILYFASGIIATLGFVMLNPETTVPLVGASGAIAGVMGAYLVLFPHARVVSVFPLLFFLPFAIPAGWFPALLVRRPVRVHVRRYGNRMGGACGGLPVRDAGDPRGQGSPAAPASQARAQTPGPSRLRVSRVVADGRALGACAGGWFPDFTGRQVRSDWTVTSPSCRVSVGGCNPLVEINSERRSGRSACGRSGLIT